MTKRERGAAEEMAHDLNNVLTATLGIAEAILARNSLDPETRADIEAIREGARRGGAAIRWRLNGPGAPREPVALDATIRATARLIAHRLGHGVTLALDLGDPEGLTRADPACLDRILLNLAANAGHAMPEGGTVTLGTRRRIVAAPEVRVPDTIPPGDYTVVAVADTGAGVRPEILPRIFQPGFTTRSGQGGRGLGLASVHAAARACRGFLSIASVEGQGTHVEVHLPRETAAVPASELAAAPAAELAPGPGPARSGGRDAKPRALQASDREVQRR